MRRTSQPFPSTVNNILRLLIEKECKKRTISTRLKERLLIILDGISGKSKYSTTKELGISKYKVSLWRRRWELSSSNLIKLTEQGDLKPHEILGLIKGVLTDKQRSGTPKRITFVQEEQIVALACDKPENHGVEMTNWTHEMLSQVAITEGIIDPISPRQIGNILKKKN